MGGSFGYLLKQGLHNTWLNRVMSLASVGILTACLIILGGVGLLSVNVRDIFKAVESQSEVVVFIEDDATADQIAELGKEIRAMEEVKEANFTSKDQALADQKESMGSKGYLLNGLEDDNPLPASYSIVLNDIEQMAQVQVKLEKLGHVESVSASTYLADTLTGIEKTLTVLGAVIIGILLVASLVVINNTIKLTVFSRRKEINIMKYVGATNNFIRLPFMFEGLIIGVISAILAFVVLTIVYGSLTQMLISSSVPWIQTLSSSVVPYGGLWYWLAGAFLVSGMLIGGMGSAAAMKKHLQV